MENEVLRAGIIIIGDEVLKGHVKDENSHYLLRELWSLGVRVCKVSVIGDGVDEIAEEVRCFSSLFDFVFTTGGLGPTHDDVTMEGIGRAFGEDLVPNAELVKLFVGEEGKQMDRSNPWSKATMLPSSTVIHLRGDGAYTMLWPLMVTHNVHSYPGVPSLLRDIFQLCKDMYSQGQARFYLKEVFFSCDESLVAHPLEKLQKEMGETVQIGSYPDDSPRSPYKVKVSLESSSRERVEKVFSRLILFLPTAYFVDVRDSYHVRMGTKADPRKEVSWLLKELSFDKPWLVPDELCLRIKESLAIIEEAMEKYRFEELCLAFNGGKDCTVLLELLHSVLKKRGRNFQSSKIKVLYINAANTFPEVEEFVNKMEASYPLEVTRISDSIRSALCQVKSSQPNLKAIFMGTRSSDPNSEHLSPFKQTDPSWPEFMRINCILNWSYHNVWQFLRLFDISYCKLYDDGYTSLANGRHDTEPNPALLRADSMDSNMEKRLPAYLLNDEALERIGRT